MEMMIEWEQYNRMIIPRYFSMNEFAFVVKAQKYAMQAHASVNHLYGNEPYIVHLQDVFENGINFIHLIEKPRQANFLAACYLHDVIPDCRKSYSEIERKFNKDVADLCFAVWEEKGHNRAEKLNEKHFSEMKLVKNAVLLKLCDRIANLKNAIQGKKYDLVEMYLKEQAFFENCLFEEKWNDNDLAWVELYSLVNAGSTLLKTKKDNG